MSDCWKDHARIAYNYSKGPFGGENHAFFEFINKIISILEDKKENNCEQFALKYEEAFNRIMMQLKQVNEHSCRDKFVAELKRIYEERKKLYD